jgi:hypothetical protein
MVSFSVYAKTRKNMNFERRRVVAVQDDAGGVSRDIVGEDEVGANLGSHGGNRV